MEVEVNRKILFQWGDGHIVTITLEESDTPSTIIKVTEEALF